MTSVRLLCTGDLHMGRYPTRIPSQENYMSLTDMWDRIVHYAIKERVDALALTGDIVDSSNKYFESYGPLRNGIQKLMDEGIAVYAVAGNHDHDVFPRLVGDISDKLFHLLGRGGSWETAPLLQDGKPVALFAGWSFPSEHVSKSPLEDFSCPKSDIPILCLVHGDLGSSESKYAPLSRIEMEAYPVAAWLLGHIHLPSYEGNILYPGSPQPLDPGEEGQHGPWLLEISPAGDVDARQIPLASLCYASLKVDVTGTEDMEEIESRIAEKVTEDLKHHYNNRQDLRRVVYRLELCGQTSLHHELGLQEYSLSERLRDTNFPVQHAIGTVDKVSVSTKPDYTLEKLAQSNDALGVLAQLLLQIEKGELNESSKESLLSETNEEIRSVYRRSNFNPLRSDRQPSENEMSEFHISEEGCRLLLRQGHLLLQEMLTQKS